MTAKGGTTGRPDYFEVTRKDGSVAVYGSTTDAKHSTYSTDSTVTVSYDGLSTETETATTQTHSSSR